MDPQLRIEAWPDPVIDHMGFSPSSPYLELWLGILGPSLCWRGAAWPVVSSWSRTGSTSTWWSSPTSSAWAPAWAATRPCGGRWSGRCASRWRSGGTTRRCWPYAGVCRRSPVATSSVCPRWPSVRTRRGWPALPPRAPVRRDDHPPLASTVRRREPLVSVPIPIEKLRPDPANPRRAGVGDVAQLAESIAELGVLQALLVTPEPTPTRRRSVTAARVDTAQVVPVPDRATSASLSERFLSRRRPRRGHDLPACSDSFLLAGARQ